jgi:hypothetical protein
MDIKLKSGRVLNANQGILGLGPELRMTEGYDSGFYFDEEDEDRLPLTREEKNEITEMMVTRWLRWQRETTSD